MQSLVVKVTFLIFYSNARTSIFALDKESNQKPYQIGKKMGSLVWSKMGAVISFVYEFFKKKLEGKEREEKKETSLC